MQTKHHLLKLFSTIAILAMMLLNVRPSIAAQIMAHPESAVIPIDLSYPADPLSDIPWSQGTSGVADIQSAFNNARNSENTQLGKSIPMLTLPNQSEWNAMSNGEKALWLINRERIDRGVAPLQGLESNVNGVAQYYADYLLSHNAWGHTEDGRTPWERLEDNPEIGACHDFLSVAENLAVFVTSGSSIALPIERSVYMWMYEDSGSQWGHRHAILWYPYNDNSGPAGAEGFLGIGRASGGPYRGPFSETWPFAELIVMNVFDPCSTWNYDAPAVSSIRRIDLNPTAESEIKFSLTFTKPVTGVDVADLVITPTGGINGASIGGITGSGLTRTITVRTGFGTGTIRLDLVDNDSIVDGSGTPLGGWGATNGNYSQGEAYTIVPANTEIYVGGTKQASHYVPASPGLRKSYTGVNNGPVEIASTDNTHRIASQRVIYGGVSYSEMMGLPLEQLTNQYIFPWYNNVAMDSQLRISNLGNIPTTITVYLGTQQIDSYTLAANGATRKNYAGKNAGPLRVTSTATDILATIRVLYGNVSYSEMMGFPASQLTNAYIFPYYNNTAMDSQLRVSNLGALPTTITVYLGNTPIDSYTLGANGATRKNYAGKNSGPLRVTSSETNILTTLRVLYGGNSYSELMGFPANQLSKEYWYPVYDNSALDSQLRVSNVGNGPTTITVYAGGQQIDSYTLEAGKATRKNYARNTGPLHVVSSSQPILTTVRLLYFTPGTSSYYEITGLPNDQLSTQYFFPWYNNTAMNSELRFAVP